MKRNHQWRALCAANSLAIACLLTTTAAQAHATLESQSAPVGSTYKAVMRIPHGCGAQPTLTLRIRIPDGFVNVKPMPKPGWTLETVKAPYDKPVKVGDAEVKEGVREVVWRGGSLSPEHYDEFVLRGSIATSLAAGTKIYFPTVQECQGAAERWIEIPAAGKPADDLQFPAPSLTLTPAHGPAARGHN